MAAGMVDDGPRHLPQTWLLGMVGVVVKFFQHDRPHPNIPISSPHKEVASLGPGFSILNNSRRYIYIVSFFSSSLEAQGLFLSLFITALNGLVL